MTPWVVEAFTEAGYKFSEKLDHWGSKQIEVLEEQEIKEPSADCGVQECTHCLILAMEHAIWLQWNIALDR